MERLPQRVIEQGIASLKEQLAGVGNSAKSITLDPELLRELLSSYGKIDEARFYEANWWRLDNLKRGLDAENQRERIAELERKLT